MGPLDHVAITGGSAKGVKGIPVQFIAVGQDATNKLVAAAGIVWTSSNPAAARVDNTGKVTLVDATSTPVTLTATAVSGTIMKTATTSITISVSAAVGFIALFGISVQNGVILLTGLQFDLPYVEKGAWRIGPIFKFLEQSRAWS